MSSERFSVSLVEVETQWSLDDLMDAHDVLDALERAEAEAAKRRPKAKD